MLTPDARHDLLVASLRQSRAITEATVTAVNVAVWQRSPQAVADALASARSLVARLEAAAGALPLPIDPLAEEAV